MGPQYGEYGSCLYDIDGRENILNWCISVMVVNQNKYRYKHKLCLRSYQIVVVVLEEIKVILLSVFTYLPTYRITSETLWISSESLVNQFCQY